MWGTGSRGDTQLRRPHLSLVVLTLLGRFSSTVVVLLQQAVLEVLGVEQNLLCLRQWPSSFEKYWDYARLELFGILTYWKALKGQFPFLSDAYLCKCFLFQSYQQVFNRLLFLLFRL